MGKGLGENGGKGTGNKIDRGEVNNNMGNGEAKELICITHGHELRGGNDGGRGGSGQRAIKGRKKMGQL